MNSRTGVLVTGLLMGLLATTGFVNAAPVRHDSQACAKAKDDPYCGDHPQSARYPDRYQSKSGIAHYLPSFGE
jgi:hypothetical protein